MRGDNFIPLLILDQILSADFLSKRSKLFGSKNWHHSGYFDTLPSLLSLLNVALGSSKDGHFSFFQRSCQLELILYGTGCKRKKQLSSSAPPRAKFYMPQQAGYLCSRNKLEIQLRSKNWKKIWVTPHVPNRVKRTHIFIRLYMSRCISNHNRPG